MAYDEYLQNGNAVLHVVTCGISADELEDEGPELEVNILRSNNLEHWIFLTANNAFVEPEGIESKIWLSWYTSNCYYLKTTIVEYVPWCSLSILKHISFTMMSLPIFPVSSSRHVPSWKFLCFFKAIHTTDLLIWKN